jgi:hypothetical protein
VKVEREQLEDRTQPPPKEELLQGPDADENLPVPPFADTR